MVVAAPSQQVTENSRDQLRPTAGRGDIASVTLTNRFIDSIPKTTETLGASMSTGKGRLDYEPRSDQCSDRSSWRDRFGSRPVGRATPDD